jgi:thioredoxin reductase (NADPH)
MEQQTYDFLIIGAGCAGASAAMYAARLNLKTAMVAELPGGLITTTHLVENWPGIKQISGPDLAQSIVDHALSYNVPLINEKVREVVMSAPSPAAGEFSGFTVRTGSNAYNAKTVLIATGTEHKKLDVPGEKEFANKGVSYCALCDAGFYRNKVAAIVGSGDSAAKEAILLAEKCSKVHILVRSEAMKAEAPNMVKIDELIKAGKIEVHYKTQITEILGKEKVDRVKLNDGSELALDGVFVAVGHIPLSEIAAKLGVSLSEKGEIKINRNSETNLPGVYGAGDVTDSSFKQAITSSAEAVTAAFHAYNYVKRNKVVFS